MTFTVHTTLPGLEKKRLMKILYVATIAGTINAFLIPHIKMLRKAGHVVDIACNATNPIFDTLLDLGCTVHHLDFQRNPVNKKNYRTYLEFEKIVENEKYNLIHTHTPVASFLTRLVCRKFKDIKVVYTAHGFHFYRGAKLRNWLLYYPLEFWLAKYTDVIITINKEDFIRAKKHFKARKIAYIPGVGLDNKNISAIDGDRALKRRELNIPENAVTLLSVGEINENKNHATVIKALAKLNNPTIYYVICGKGPLENHLKNLALELGVAKQVLLLGYRHDLADIYKVVDIFVFPSFREGLPVSVMEAMRAKLPIVCSDIRGNSDLIDQDKGGYRISLNEVDGYTEKLHLLTGSLRERKKFGEYNGIKVKEYGIENVLIQMDKLYKEIPS